MKIVITGAGVAGLSIGWRLLQAGATVTILERAQPATGASWAAAGMLAVTAELEHAAEPELAFAKNSNALWPDFATEIERDGGRKIGFSQSGALILSEDATALAVMQARADADAALSVLGPEGLQSLVPMLTGEYSGGLWASREAHVDSRALCQALIAVFLKAGGILKPLESVVRFEQSGTLVSAVITPYGRYAGDAFLVAAGAWSGLIENVPITPVKGQMIALAPPSGVALPGPVIWGEGIYLVPRNGRLLVGATVEEVGFDTSLTAEARDSLWTRAAGLMPGLAGWTLVEHWAGLRPASADGLPLLGPTLLPNLFVAGGQFRNGILFTPAIARLMADLILGRGHVIPAFDPRRFS